MRRAKARGLAGIFLAIQRVLRDRRISKVEAPTEYEHSPRHSGVTARLSRRSDSEAARLQGLYRLSCRHLPAGEGGPSVSTLDGTSRSPTAR